MPRKFKPAGMAEAPSLFDPSLFGPRPVDSRPADPRPADPRLVDPNQDASQLSSAQSAVGAEGHRARMRARLLAAGPEALADHEMLEMVLFLALPRRDTKPIAKLLLARFGNFGAVIGAPPGDLLRVEGLGEAGSAALKLVQAAAVRLGKGAVMAQPVLRDWSLLQQYLLSALAHEKTEQFRVLFLNSRNRLLADETMSRGTTDHTPVYPREIVRRALELHAHGVILVHNHPSGEATPSREDVAMTNAVKKAVEALDMVLHDHLIVAGDRIFSFKHELGM